MWNADNLSFIKRLQTEKNPNTDNNVVDIRISHNEEMVLLVNKTRTATLINTSSTQIIGDIYFIYNDISLNSENNYETGSFFPSKMIIFSPDDNYILNVCGNSMNLEWCIMVWDAHNCKPITSFGHHHNSVTSLQYCGVNNEFIVTTYYDGTGIIWNSEDFSVVHTFRDYHGLYVKNLDLRVLNSQTVLSSEIKGMLSEYGAIFDERSKLMLQTIKEDTNETGELKHR